MCSNKDKKIKELFNKAAQDAYNEKMKADGKNDEVVSTFDELIDKIPALSTVLCEDQYFGIIRIEKSNPSFCEWIAIPVFREKENMTREELRKLKKSRLKKDCCIRTKAKRESLKTIVIVLESPHDKEFFKVDNIYENIGPACGTTGENLMKWFPEVLINYVPSFVDQERNFKAKYDSLKDIESGDYAIKLLNAIQYQCSLGDDTKEYRDAIFSKMWDNDEVRDCFTRRLKNSNPTIIINCCTKGNESKKKEKELRRLVQKEINIYGKKTNCLLLRAAHPSSYHFRNGLSWVEQTEE